MTRITALAVHDLRFPTSAQLDGSDAMNPDPDYSAAYVILSTDTPYQGHGLSFTIGRGNEVVCLAIRALEQLVVGLDLDWILEAPGRFWRHITGDSQLRWIGPDKGVMHMATGAVVNAVWDLLAKLAGKPVWRLVADMTPAQLVAMIDFRYLGDAITPTEALAIFERAATDKGQRLTRLMDEGYPCYTTSAGWLGYSNEKLAGLAEAAVASGFTHIKMKIGQDLDDDIRRLKIVREIIGPDRKLLVDANQVWEVDQAIAWIEALRPFDLFFVEEPTSPDDVEGHRKIRNAISPIKVATGEMCQNRIVFKQFMSREAIDIVQIDACRIGGLNEALAVLVLAAKFERPVWPHAGGVGLCEYVQHISMIDFLVVSGEKDDRYIEYVDHLHEHFLNPCRMRGATYVAPTGPGFSIEMKPDSIRKFHFAGAPAK